MITQNLSAPPPNAPTAKPVTAPRERILLTAHALFYRDGIRATGIDRVIAQSGVAKATFYRHFPSKNDLIAAYLDYRHNAWMAWFRDALARHGDTPASLIPTLSEWFDDPGFRGCAFINSVGELGGDHPDILAQARAHKADMAAAIAKLLPEGAEQDQRAQALALAVDGAIIRAQTEGQSTSALAALARLVAALIPISA